MYAYLHNIYIYIYIYNLNTTYPLGHHHFMGALGCTRQVELAKYSSKPGIN